MVSQEAGRHAQLHILGIAGSMRQGSYSTQVLKMVLEEAKKYKIDTQILELRQVNLSIYDPSTSNESNNNNDIERVSNALKWADSIILIDSYLAEGHTV
jgi:NAD(P)H-dependent FMN reductase